MTVRGTGAGSADCEELPVLSDYGAKHAHRGFVCRASVWMSLASRSAQDGGGLEFSRGAARSAYAGGYGRMWRSPVNFTTDRNGLLADKGWDSSEPAWTAERLDHIVTPLLR